MQLPRSPRSATRTTRTKWLWPKENLAVATNDVGRRPQLQHQRPFVHSPLFQTPPTEHQWKQQQPWMFARPAAPLHAPLQISASPLLLASVLPSSAASVSFFKLLLAFTLGGLFFSTAIAGVTACYAMGMDNVTRTLDMVSYVIRKVWNSFAIGIGASRLALRQRGEGKGWFWRDAWNVFKEQLIETRRTAREGVDAIRREAGIYAAAVGQPGLVPVQYVLDRLMPHSLATMLEESFKESLGTYKSTGTIKKLTLRSFKAGTSSPQLKSARIYDVPDALAFDCVVSWKSDMEAKINVHVVGGLARLPVSVRNVRFDGVVRVILTPLTSEQPGYGATLVSLPSLPRIGLDVRVAGGEVTRVPWLRSEIMNAIRDGMRDTLLWPRRTVIPTKGPNNNKLLSRHDLEALERTDPLHQTEMALEKEQSIFRDKSNKPNITTFDTAFNITLGDDSNSKPVNGARHDHKHDGYLDRYSGESEQMVRLHKTKIESGIFMTSLFKTNVPK